ncbi:MAG: hypothetical protein RLW61_19950 [Gammaproteobacteria bacterium]
MRGSAFRDGRHAIVASDGHARRRRRVRRLQILSTLLSLVPLATFAAPPARTLFGLPYYSHGAIENFAQLLALPFLCIALLRHRRLEGWPYLGRVARTTLLLLLVWELAWNADVLFTSLRVAYLCKVHGGPHVYRTVEVEGFKGRFDIESIARKGFQYVETYGAYPGAKDVRLSMHDGQAISEPIEGLTSRYEYVRSYRTSAGYAIEKSGQKVIDRKDGSILGELVVWMIRPGLFDRLWLSLVPGRASPWTCGDVAPIREGRYDSLLGYRVYPSDYLAGLVLKPKSNAKFSSSTNIESQP